MKTFQKVDYKYHVIHCFNVPFAFLTDLDFILNRDKFVYNWFFYGKEYSIESSFNPPLSICNICVCTYCHANQPFASLPTGEDL